MLARQLFVHNPFSRYTDHFVTSKSKITTAKCLSSPNIENNNYSIFLRSLPSPDPTKFVTISSCGSRNMFEDHYCLYHGSTIQESSITLLFISTFALLMISLDFQSCNHFVIGYLLTIELVFFRIDSTFLPAIVATQSLLIQAC